MPRQIVLGDVVEETANVAQDFRRQFDARHAHAAGVRAVGLRGRLPSARAAR